MSEHPMSEQPASPQDRRENSSVALESPATLELNRRKFLATTAAAGAIPLLSQPAQALQTTSLPPTSSASPPAKSLIGSYGVWVAGIAEKPPLLSWRRDGWDNIEAWRAAARAKTSELIAAPDLEAPTVTVVDRVTFDDLEVEHLSWQLPYGRATRAVLIKPRQVQGPLPGILALHDHGGNKYFGLRKITHTAAEQHPLMVEHQQHYYGGRAWANEIAKRGYVVLIHDAFAFASRRVRFDEMSTIPWGETRTQGHSDDNPEAVENIRAYNTWASAHEDVMAKSLFCGGTTWPGMFLAEDQAALSLLAARPEVDADRLGCAGLSGGGLRTVYLGGLDPRIACAVCVGFMSTWNDFLLNKSYTHTWMTYAPLLPRYLDFPEILGLRVPLPTMVQSCTEDQLYTLPQMEKADEILQQVFAKAGQLERYRGKFYPGGHKFDEPMQADAFDWFDRWLK